MLSVRASGQRDDTLDPESPRRHDADAALRDDLGRDLHSLEEQREIHRRGGRARWAAVTDWRAKYGTPPRGDPNRQAAR